MQETILVHFVVLQIFGLHLKTQSQGCILISPLLQFIEYTLYC